MVRTLPQSCTADENDVNTVKQLYAETDFQELQFSHPFWKITKLVRRIRTGARKLESFKSFGNKKPQIFFTRVSPGQEGKT